MPAKKTQGLKLESLIGRYVKIKPVNNEVYQGPLKVLGMDQGFICIEIGHKSCWWSLSGLEAIREDTDAE